MKKIIHAIPATFAAVVMSLAGMTALSSCSSSDSGQTCVMTAAQTPERNAEELFYSDSLNAYYSLRPYPLPKGTYTPAPKGYKPVYISSYARHGSRKLHRLSYPTRIQEAFAAAEAAGGLTPLGEEIYAKVRAIAEDMETSVGDLTSVGVEQHRGIAERMYRNYPGIFRDGAPVRLYSTTVPRTIMSMNSCNGRLVERNPNLRTTARASGSLTFLNDKVEDPQKLKNDMDIHGLYFVRNYFDVKPVIDRLFTEDAPALEDPVRLVDDLYITGGVVRGLDIRDVDYIWDLFTYEELYRLMQAESYMFYTVSSNSPQLGENVLNAIKSLLKDYVDRADEALAQDIPGADLRFGHDIYVNPLAALIGINGYVAVEDDPLRVIDTFQDFAVSPMAGNIQMVFYRNRSGDVLVKVLLNEEESWIPLDTDVYPYYHWSDVRNYFVSLIEG